MIVEHLENFVSALYAVIETNPELHEVDMGSVEAPECGTPGCHAALSKAALDRLGVEPCGEEYRFTAQADRLSAYLTGEVRLGGEVRPLESWAENNPSLWGNSFGLRMLRSGSAFDQHSERFPAHIIAAHWARVLERISTTTEQ